MKKLFYLLGVAAILAIVIVACEKTQNAVEPQEQEAVLKGGDNCIKIQSGLIVNSAGDVIETGYDDWGYNFQAHIFNGYYCDAYQDAAWCQPYADVELLMKWNDAWISNKDCDGDTYLDRHYGFDSYIGSGAWLTNHQKGTYTDVDGNECYWDYFVKIIAVPADATETDGVWYNADGVEIGPSIWGQFAIIQQVENDPCAGIEGMQYVSPDHPGLGGW